MAAGLEVKAAGTASPSDGRGLAALASRLGESWLGGVVLYTGAHAFPLDPSKRIYAVPVERLWTSAA